MSGGDDDAIPNPRLGCEQIELEVALGSTVGSGKMIRPLILTIKLSSRTRDLV